MEWSPNVVLMRVEALLIHGGNQTAGNRCYVRSGIPWGRERGQSVWGRVLGDGRRACHEALSLAGGRGVQMYAVSPLKGFDPKVTNPGALWRILERGVEVESGTQPHPSVSTSLCQSGRKKRRERTKDRSETSARERERETDSVSLPTLNTSLESYHCFVTDFGENVYTVWIYLLLFFRVWCFLLHLDLSYIFDLLLVCVSIQGQRHEEPTGIPEEKEWIPRKHSGQQAGQNYEVNQVSVTCECVHEQVIVCWCIRVGEHVAWEKK